MNLIDWLNYLWFAWLLKNKKILCQLCQFFICMYREENLNRRLVLFLSVTTSLFPNSSCSAKTKIKSPFDERRLLEQNKRIQKENNVPEDFPSFIREGLFQLSAFSNTLSWYVVCSNIFLNLVISLNYHLPTMLHTLLPFSWTLWNDHFIWITISIQVFRLR